MKCAVANACLRVKVFGCTDYPHMWNGRSNFVFQDGNLVDVSVIEGRASARLMRSFSTILPRDALFRASGLRALLDGYVGALTVSAFDDDSRVMLFDRADIIATAYFALKFDDNFDANMYRYCRIVIGNYKTSAMPIYMLDIPEHDDCNFRIERIGEEIGSVISALKTGVPIEIIFD